MVFEFKFPDVGEGITEGEIVKWRVKEGDTVKEEQILAEVETDKAVVEIPSPKAGVVLALSHKEGDTIKVGETLITIGEKGEKAPPVPVAPVPAAPPKPVPVKAEAAPEQKKFGVVGEIPEEIAIPVFRKAAPAAPVQSTPASVSGAPPVLPAVRRLAQELHMDLSTVRATGIGGRITEEDVRRAHDAAPPATPALKITKKYDMWGYVDRQPLKGIRKATATHMMDAVSATAYVTSTDEADVSVLWGMREKEKEKAKSSGVHLTFMPFIVKAVVRALKKHPYMNAEVDTATEEILIKKYYNIGIAVDLEGGLMVPVVKGVDQKNIMQLAKEIQDLGDKARDRKIDLGDLKGGTFSITNFGTLGGIFATPIPNHPEVAILGTGKMADQPRVVNGIIKIRKVLPLSLTFDHRVLDGAEAQRFVNDLKEGLEDPDLLMMGD